MEVSFSHNDLLYATSFPTARFGLGAFAIALKTLYQEVTHAPELARISALMLRAGSQKMSMMAWEHAWLTRCPICWTSDDAKH